MDDKDYFELRRISPETYGTYRIPDYLTPYLPDDRNASVLDFGCGYGQLLGALVAAGYRNACGTDLLPSALAYCRSHGLNVIDATRADALTKREGEFSLIVLSHVLEHMDKADIIPQLKQIRELLTKNGALLVAVPNAQSHTGAYWAYEDFTHTTLFTSGSLWYVLRAAGFSRIGFVDVDCTAGLSWHKKMLRRLLLALYRANYIFWNRVTASYTHAPSTLIFSYEIKAVARA